MVQSHGSRFVTWMEQQEDEALAAAAEEAGNGSMRSAAEMQQKVGGDVGRTARRAE